MATYPFKDGWKRQIFCSLLSSVLMTITLQAQAQTAAFDPTSFDRAQSFGEVSRAGLAPGDRALLVGIDQYQDPGLNLPRNSSTKDTRDVYRLAVEAMGFREDQILILTNEKATRANILGAVDKWLIAGSAPGSRILFQYSGHGSQISDRNGDEDDGKDEVLVPWDTTKGPNVAATLVIDDELETRFSRLKDRKVTILLDSCHSGTATRNLALIETGGGDDRDMARFVELDEGIASRGVTRAGDNLLNANVRNGSFVPRSGNIMAWSAVNASEVALVDGSASPLQGVFTRRLIEAVVQKRADANHNGIISNAEVLNYLRAASEQYCNQSPTCARKGKSLTPTLEADPDWLARDFRTGKLANDTAGAVTDALGQGATGAGATGGGQNAAETPGAANPGPLRIGVLPSDEVSLGKEVTFEVVSPIAGHLAVLDINAAGQVTQIFPNEFSKAAGNKIAAKRALRLPEPNYGFAFEAQPPTGKGTLVAVVTSDSVNLDDLVPPSRGFGPVQRPVVVVAEIVQRVTKALENRMSAQKVQWSYAIREYSITP